MRPLPIQHLFLAPFLLAGLANTVRSQTTHSPTEERIPSPLPRMEDVKTPARPAPPKTDAAPLARRASSAPSLSRPKPDPDLEQGPPASGRSRSPVAPRAVWLMLHTRPDASGIVT